MFLVRRFSTRVKQLSDGIELEIVANAGTGHGKFHYSWLRDHCQCPLCVHKDSRQKLHSSADVDLSAGPTKVELIPASDPSHEERLELTWPSSGLRIRSPTSSLPHKTSYPVSWLVEHSYQKGLSALRPKPMSPTLWTAEQFRSAEEKISYGDFMNTKDGLKRGLHQLRDYGLLFLKDSPVEDDKEVERIARRLGCIRETFYGTSWDVKSVPQAKNIAYTALDLGLHMDLMYFEAPPGIQILHSLVNSVTGGQSTFLDSFYAVKKLREKFPEDYDILKRVPVTFRYLNDGHSLKFRRPTIVDNDFNDELKVYYAPPFQGQLEAEEELVEPFYRAFQRFSDLLLEPGLVYRTLLRQGDTVLFNNRRVLHGRDEFDPSSGMRHFKGTYVDLDDFNDRVNSLSFRS